MPGKGASGNDDCFPLPFACVYPLLCESETRERERETCMSETDAKEGAIAMASRDEIVKDMRGGRLVCE